jgi:hypothetical protein
MSATSSSSSSSAPISQDKTERSVLEFLESNPFGLQPSIESSTSLPQLDSKIPLPTKSMIIGELSSNLRNRALLYALRLQQLRGALTDAGKGQGIFFSDEVKNSPEKLQELFLQLESQLAQATDSMGAVLMNMTYAANEFVVNTLAQLKKDRDIIRKSYRKGKKNVPVSVMNERLDEISSNTSNTISQLREQASYLRQAAHFPMVDLAEVNHWWGEPTDEDNHSRWSLKVLRTELEYLLMGKGPNFEDPSASSVTEPSNDKDWKKVTVENGAESSDENVEEDAEERKYSDNNNKESKVPAEMPKHTNNVITDLSSAQQKILNTIMEKKESTGVLSPATSSPSSELQDKVESVFAANAPSSASQEDPNIQMKKNELMRKIMDMRQRLSSTSSVSGPSSSSVPQGKTDELKRRIGDMHTLLFGNGSINNPHNVDSISGPSSSSKPDNSKSDGYRIGEMEREAPIAAGLNWSLLRDQNPQAHPAQQYSMGPSSFRSDPSSGYQSQAQSAVTTSSESFNHPILGKLQAGPWQQSSITPSSSFTSVPTSAAQVLPGKIWTPSMRAQYQNAATTNCGRYKEICNNDRMKRFEELSELLQNLTNNNHMILSQNNNCAKLFSQLIGVIGTIFPADPESARRLQYLSEQLSNEAQHQSQIKQIIMTTNRKLCEFMIAMDKCPLSSLQNEATPMNITMQNPGNPQMSPQSVIALLEMLGRMHDPQTVPSPFSVGREMISPASHIHFPTQVDTFSSQMPMIAPTPQMHFPRSVPSQAHPLAFQMLNPTGFHRMEQNITSPEILNLLGMGYFIEGNHRIPHVAQPSSNLTSTMALEEFLNLVGVPIN